MKLHHLAVLCLILALCIPCLAADIVSARGIVVDPEGKPVSGVKVYAVLRAASYFVVSTKGATTSGGDGRFALTALPRPKPDQGYDLIAVKPGEYLGWAEGHGELYRRFRRQPLPAGDYRIIVSKPGVFEGRVVDEAGNPIAGAEVVPFALFARSGGRGSGGPVPSAVGVDMLKGIATIPSATTDSEGVFRIQGVPAHADPSLGADKSGYAMERRSVEEIDPRRIVLLLGGTIVGSVVDTHGKAVSGVDVFTAGSRPATGSAGRAKTAPDGSYTIGGLLPASYYVRVLDLKDAAAAPVQDVLVKARETTRAPMIVVSPGVAIHVRVIDADTGKPVTKGRVSAYALHWSQSTYITSMVDEKGRHTFRVLPGDYEVHFQGESMPYKYVPTSSMSVTVPKAGVKDLVIKVKKADIARGKVVDPSGTPLAGASVSVGAPWDSKTTTDASGGFTAIVPPAQKSAPG